jgi:hypothetical protein
MDKVCRMVVGLLLILTVSIGLARLIGSTQSARLAMLFTNWDTTPCQRPCLFGVQPGQTSYNQAVELLRHHPFTYAFQSTGTRNMVSDGSLSIILSLDAADEVSRITVVSFSNSSGIAVWGSLGEVVALLGAPKMVEQDTGYIQSYYRDGNLIFSHQYTSGDLTFNEPCMEISVYLAATGLTPVVGPGGAKGRVMSWQNFRKDRSH